MATESFFSNASLAYLASAGAGKDGKTYSIKPTDGTGDFTFSRGSNLAATRVGADGLIEKGRENLVLQSNNFDTTWATTNASVTSGQSGYDGSNDAWQITATATSSSFVRQFVNVTSQVSTFSVYAKAGNVDWAFLNCVGITAYYDLNNGVVGTATGGVNLIDTKIVSVGNGWWKISITGLGIEQQRIYAANGDLGFDTAIGEYIYIQDAQLEIGLAATDYIESGATTGKAGLLEDEPRFDYSGGATCPSLLLEPSRTQYLQYTEYLDPSTSWSAYPAGDPVTHTQNYAIAPDGTQTASLLGNFTSGGFNVVSNSNFRSSTLVSQNPLDDTYTISVWLKTTSGTGTITLLNRGLSAGTNTFQHIQCNVTNEWQRFYVSNTYAAAEGAASLGFILIRSTTDTLEEVLVWGAQVEQGSYPTSYIPNHSGGSVTRGGDSCVKTGISSLIGQTEGTLFAVMKKNDILAAEGGVKIDNGTTNTRISINFAPSTATTTRLNLFANKGGVLGAYNDTYITPLQNTTKVAVGYAENNLAFYANGVQMYTDNSFPTYTSDNLTRLLVHNSGLEIEQILLFPTRLTNAELAALTTL